MQTHGKNRAMRWRREAVTDEGSCLRAPKTANMRDGAESISVL